MFTAVACSALLTSSCSGHDIDIGNGVDGINGTRTTGGSMSTSTGSPGTTGNETTTSTTTEPGTTAVTTGGSGGGPGTTGGTGGSAGGGSGGSTGVSVPPSAIVIRYGDIPPSNPGGGTSVTTGGPMIDPDTPYVFVGTSGSTCQDPMASLACGTWRVAIGIPRALFQPGVLSLNDSRLISVMSSRGPDRGGGDCSGGGGSFFDGTLEIVDIGATIVDIRLAGTSKLDFNADGAYAATNCQ
jgi:hypothetical protein